MPENLKNIAEFFLKLVKICNIREMEEDSFYFLTLKTYDTFDDTPWLIPECNEEFLVILYKYINGDISIFNYNLFEVYHFSFIKEKGMYLLDKTDNNDFSYFNNLFLVDGVLTDKYYFELAKDIVKIPNLNKFYFFLGK